LAASLAEADRVFVFSPAELGWDARRVLAPLGERLTVSAAFDGLVAAVCAAARAGDHVLVMSNGGFGGIHERLLDALAPG
jgi:UDP-N-acetylmuramate: L-alanyl-gamma-D-glutamyl-meso-diaminopimelate ligase